MIKQIVLQIGRKFIDFCAWLDMGIIAVALIFFIFFIWSGDFENSNKLQLTVIALFLALILFIISILAKYLIYLLVDIKDNIAKIAGIEEDKINKNISKIFLNFIAILLSTVIIGLFFCCFDYFNKTLLNQKDNFTIMELNNKIKQVNKYNDTVTRETFGFSYNPENTRELKIIEVTPNSSAEQMGLKKNDIIIKINNYNISSGYNKEKLNKIIKKNKKVKITYLRNKINNTVEIFKHSTVVQNIIKKPDISIYFNSMDFKNNYALGFFKIPHVDGSYTKDLTVCNCDVQHKTIISIWNADYNNGYIVREYNALKEKNLSEEIVIPNTFGYIKWLNVCTPNNEWTDEIKKSYKQNVKKTR